MNNKISDSLAEIMGVYTNLEEIADAFYKVGNETLSTQLFQFAKVLNNQCENIKSNLAESVFEQFELSQENSKTILETALAATKIALESK